MEVLIENSYKSDDEDDVAPIMHNNNYRKLLDSDSEDEKPPTQKIVKKIESSDESSKSSDESNKSSDSDVNDSNDEPDTSVVEEKKDRRKNANPKKKILPVKTQRKAASKAIETIKDAMSHKQQLELKEKIQSEKQRMEREQDIHVPYHKPKQYSLKEFMSRRTINKPSVEKIRRGEMPMSSIMALKMRSKGEGLEKFAQQMKEREEEALEFFKSESESEDEAENKENVSENTTAPNADENDDKKDEKLVELPAEVQLNEIPEPTETDKEEKVHVLDQPSTDPEPIPSVESESNPDSPPTNSISDVKMEEPMASLDSDLERLREKYKNIPDFEDLDPAVIKAEKIEKLNARFSSLTVPTLKTLQEMGSNDVCIDLSTGVIEPRKLTGPEMLFQRYLKTVQKPKAKDSICMNILSVENGKLENQKVEVKLNKEIEVVHDRPGYARGKLQGSLLSQIKQQRHEEIMKSLETKKEMELEPEDKPEHDEAGDQDEDEDMEEECEEEEEVEENDVDMTDRKKKKSKGSGFFDEEAVDEDGSEHESESEESSSSSEEEEAEEETGLKKGRILKAFVDSDDEGAAEDKKLLTVVVADPITSIEKPIYKEPHEDRNELEDSFKFTQETVVKDSEDLFSTQPSDFTFTEPSVSEEIKPGGIELLCDEIPSQMMDDDLMDICSGRFATQAFTLGAFTTQANLVSLEPTPADDHEDSDFVSQVPEREEPKVAEQHLESKQIEPEATKEKSPEKNRRQLLDSTDDEADVVDGAAKEKRKKRKKKRKMPVKKLGFSDDEEEEILNQLPLDEQQEDEELEEECEEEEEVDLLVDYDSEENEVEVKMSKKERIKAAGNYFDEEAELSESEWGSADEDEKDLNKYEGELGDEDEFDQEKLQQEVGRIHARKILDDDIRNVKKIEELLFESEENDGVGRERKFRWKNQKEGFALQDENAQDGNLLEEDEDEESEIAWRKMRHERETLLSEHASQMTESATLTDEITIIDCDSQTVTSTSTSALVKQKFKIIRSSSAMECPSVTDTKKDSPFLIKTANFKKFRNSSFLSRDEQTLSKIARLVSTKDDEVTNFSHGSNSMSFMTIEKPDELKKRKSDSNAQQEAAKKRKVVQNPKQLLLDQLK